MSLSAVTARYTRTREGYWLSGVPLLKAWGAAHNYCPSLSLSTTFDLELDKLRDVAKCAAFIEEEGGS